ncbi:MAG TPA: TIGR02677 family protein [Myxococcales bacterium]|jgi:uncharacterized protein (TIGR02677 family)
MDSRPGQIRAFAYLNADKAELYRAVLGVFVQAKERFSLHLRPAELLRAVASDGSALDPKEIDAALAQLCDWGNLEAHADTAEVATVEDFYRPRFLYQLTAAGEAAERAVRTFHQWLVQPGELQTAALADIVALLRELEQQAAEPNLDASKVARIFKSLMSSLEELTSRAQIFMRSLQRTIDLQGATVEAFLAYKERLIEYLERFIGEMVVSGSEIALALERLDALGADRLLRAAADRELVDAVDATPESRARTLEGWRGRWAGLRAWFLTLDDVPSQAEVLRARARSAIPALISAVANLHDRRLTRADRSTDWRTLARWFAELDSDDQAHRLWRAATGLPPARHLAVDEVSRERWELDDAGPQTSWLEAAPLRISLRLRATGRYSRRGRLNDVVDKSREKAELARLARLEAEQLEQALRHLATGTATRLSLLGGLDPLEFGLLLDLLGEALAARTQADVPVETTSSDGGLAIRMEPVVEEPGACAVIEVAGLGRLAGPDYLVTIRRLTSRPAGDAA